MRQGWVGLLAALACALALAIALGSCASLHLTRTKGERLGDDIARAVRTEGRGKCEIYAGSLWSCRVESDPGSGWSGTLHLRLGKNGCWRARHVRFDKGRGQPVTRSSLSAGDLEAYGRTLTGCL